jgi:transcription elongation factor GreB
VGVDEANARDGRLAFTSPLARALLGRRVGETVPVHTPGAERQWEVIEISYPAPEETTDL